MQEYRNPAVVLGGGGITGLGAARALGRAGVIVYCIEEEKETMVRYSRYCNKYFVFPGTARNKNELKKALLKLQHHTNEALVIFPESDFYTLVLSDLIDELPRYCLPIARREVAEILIDKRRF